MASVAAHPNDQIFDILFQGDEITWQSLLLDLVKSEEMNEWDIDLVQLSNKFVDMLKKLQGMDFRISGKVVLACAILLKLKSDRLLEQDIFAFDNLLNTSEEELEEFFEEPFDELGDFSDQVKVKPKLIPRTPQPRKRKVSIYDLINALEKAIEVSARRDRFQVAEVKVKIPEKKRDISVTIRNIYNKIQLHYKNNEDMLRFNQLLPEDASKEDKIFTFIPLLHLTNQQRIDLHQEQHFGDIDIELLHEGDANEIVAEVTETGAWNF